MTRASSPPTLRATASSSSGLVSSRRWNGSVVSTSISSRMRCVRASALGGRSSAAASRSPSMGALRIITSL
ncbi:hypothetical protein [Nonomuraea rubra]|uniref:Uncharacterized protein n=1 Tax=Nonomuraea rubra TaxID=46180 RepID=A0A7X0NX00_9ACTN|nr:hypothetical protein [Nonomuraea rubra]MBB6551155.1 hypothetical protein [Nonomuraea rubra]